MMLLLSAFAGFVVAIAAGDASTSFADHCQQGIDVVFVQDTTGSLQYQLTKMTIEIESLLEEIESHFTYARTAVVQYKDKPIDPMGIPGYDFCYRLSQPLTSDNALVRKAYASFAAGGGGDLPEAAYHAIWDAARDRRIGWRPLSSSAKSSEQYAASRVIVVLTDAQPHFAGQTSLPPFPGTSKTKDEFSYDCRAYDYPSPQQVKDVLKEEKIKLVSAILLDPSLDAFPAWRWVNDNLLEQPADYCFRISEGAKDIKQQLIEVFEIIRNEIVCTTAPPTTTTPTTATTTVAPTTTTPTTTTPTTTTPTTTTPTTTTPTTTTPTTTTPTTTTPTTTTPTTTTPTTATHTTTTPPQTTAQTTATASSLETEASTGSDSLTSSIPCGCHCGCGCGCGCAHRCCGGSADAPLFVINIPSGNVKADISLLDIPEGLANLSTP